MRRYLFLMLIIALTTISCKKKKLEGDSEILVGNWQWNYTNAVYDICYPPNYTQILTPQSEGNNYDINFIQKGITEFHHNEQLDSTGRIVEILIGADQSSNIHFSYSFTIYVKKDGITSTLSGSVGEDTLLLTQGFPFTDNNCENYSNYFVRK